MGQSLKKVERWKEEMPTEQEMLPKDKYSVFDRKMKRYRKGIHSAFCVFLFALLVARFSWLRGAKLLCVAV